MLRFLPFAALDPARWDACVAASPGAPVSARAWWLAATAGRWDALVEPGPGGEYRALLPLPRRWRPGGWRAYQPHFTQQLGLLRTPDSRLPDLAPWLALAQRHCPGGFYQQGAPGPLPPADELPPGWTARARLTYLLDLSPPAEVLRRGYAADYRRRVRRLAEAGAPPVAAGAGVEELIQLFLTYRPADHTGLRPRHYGALRRLYAAAQARGLAEVRELRDARGALLAGALFVRHPGGLVYLFAAASAAGREAKAPLRLLDDAIGRHAGQPGQVLDFEGGNLPAIGRFFANFGARPGPLPVLQFTPQPWFSRWLRR